MNRGEFVRRIRGTGIERDEERRIYAAGVLNEALEKGIDSQKSETQVKIIAYLLGDQINEEEIRGRLVRESLWDLWIRIKAEVDDYGP